MVSNPAYSRDNKNWVHLMYTYYRNYIVLKSISQKKMESMPW